MTDTKVEPAFIVGQHDRNSEIQAIQTISVSIPSRAGRLGQPTMSNCRYNSIAYRDFFRNLN